MNKQGIVLKWLNKEFGDLTPEVNGNIRFYFDKDRKPLFYYYMDEKNGVVFIHYERIWVFFDSIFGMEYRQTMEIITIWLDETYNLRKLTPHHQTAKYFKELEETYNLR
jgi:hypothetical protein